MTLENAFAELRPAMFALAYRITGNRADAEEIVQDAFVRLHHAEPKDAVRSLKAYLTTITARLSFNRLRDQRARRETYVGEWLPEPLVTEGEPDVHPEDVSFAMVAVLERLSPLERVVFVLRNAFDFTFKEIAPVVGREAVACRQIFTRARARMREARPRFPVDRERHHALLRSFTEAARGGDQAKLVSLLSADVVLHGDGGGKALAAKKPVLGKVAVAKFIIAVTRAVLPGASLEEIDLNGAPGLVVRAGGRPITAILIDTDGERIHSVFAVANPDKLEALAVGR
ncbi:MAG TPA: RNA polymerase sigma factor SigJ [Burkholderiales bacterium]|nr:RNA polymerase sigma factor SigJ [Burkholderiales bacterium]